MGGGTTTTTITTATAATTGVRAGTIGTPARPTATATATATVTVTAATGAAAGFGTTVAVSRAMVRTAGSRATGRLRRPRAPMTSTASTLGCRWARPPSLRAAPRRGRRAAHTAERPAPQTRCTCRRSVWMRQPPRCRGWARSRPSCPTVAVAVATVVVEMARAAARGEGATRIASRCLCGGRRPLAAQSTRRRARLSTRLWRPPPQRPLRRSRLPQPLRWRMATAAVAACIDARARTGTRTGRTTCARRCFGRRCHARTRRWARRRPSWGTRRRHRRRRRRRRQARQPA